ncbi:MAG: biotin transporter BioY [Ruminococcaceae bacterium]|nr:biotin transporter BioY [Oscillospiraceae bacterium]
MTEKNEKKFRTLDLAYVGLGVALIAVCSWISIPLTVPITLQTLGVCMIAGLFGLRRGTLATFVYLLLGTVGVPLFAQFTGGIGIITGPTGGYLIGFIFTALIVGFASDKWGEKLWAVILAMIGGVLVCYAFGTAWFAFVYAKSNEPASLVTILGWCVFPFIPFDAVKIIIAALLTNRLKRFVK